MNGGVRVEKTGVTGEGQAVAMTRVSSSVPVREACWTINRSVPKTTHYYF